jgi:hypothetical protein
MPSNVNRSGKTANKSFCSCNKEALTDTFLPQRLATCTTSFASSGVIHIWTLNFLERLVKFCSVAAVDRSIISMALTANFKDFEDAIQYSTAIASQMDAIVTRNISDFANATKLQILTPDRLIQSITP